MVIAGPSRVLLGPAISLALAISTLSAPAAPGEEERAAADRELRQVVAAVPRSWPPQYSLDEHGKPTGFAIDVMEEVAARADLRVTYRVFDSFPEAIKALNSGEADLIPNSGIIPERLKESSFTSPVETFVISIFVRDDTLDVKGLDDLAGRRVAVVERNVGVRLLKSRPEITSVMHRDLQTALFNLIAAQVDAVVFPRPVIQKLAREVGLENRIKIVGEPLLEVRRGIRVRKDKTELLALLDAAVTRFVDTPEYQSIYLKWYGSPKPYWTIARALSIMGAVVLVVLIALVWWRYRSILNLNRGLRESISERERAEKALRKHSESIRLLHRVAVAANEAYQFETAMQVGLDEICAYTGWPVGHVYRVDAGSDELASLTIWHLDNPERFATFRRVTEDTRFAPGIGPGRVLSSREPAWIVDVTKDPNFPRAKLAEDIGVKAGFAFPVLAGKDVDAVMEFFSTEAVEPDEHILEIMAQVGTQLGRVIERKRAEDALRASEMRLSGILEIAPEAIVSVDENQVIRLFNQGAQAIFGYTIEETIGKHLDLLLPDRFTDAHRKHIEQFTKSSEVNRLMTQRGEIVGLRKDRTEFPAEASISKLDLGDQKIFTVILRDITERKAAEQQLRQAQKMEAIGQLTGGVAHDFNNVLSVILGNLELVEEELEPDSKLKPDINIAIRAVNRGAELTQRLLAFSRRQALQPNPVDANRLIQGMTDLLQRTLGETIEIDVVSAAGLWACLVDAGQLENALLNLAINARDAMPEGGHLTIETANIQLDDEYATAQGDVNPGDYVRFSVTDTGTGIAPHVIEHIFEPFFTTKDVGQGTGLGLSMIYGFVKQSDGHITIYSEEGHGTTVNLFLPKSAGSAEQASEPVTTEDSVGRGETILVVEDDENIRRHVVRVLSRLGYSVLEAGNGEVALEIFQGSPGVDLLFSDVVLPGGRSGPDILAAAQRRQPNIKFLFMSGYAPGGMSQQGRLPEGATLLQKPFTQHDLAQKVRDVLDR